MSRVEVEYGELGQVAAGLKAFQDDSGRAHAALGELDKAASGHAGLATAVAGFRQKWDYSLQKIAETAQSLGDRLEDAGEGYAETDNQLADAAKGRAGDAQPAAAPGPADAGIDWSAPAFGA
jgi:uncharacterized protein YukE